MYAYADESGNVECLTPADAPRMISRWEELGRPAIELEPGVIVSNLQRWLDNNLPASGTHLGRIREYLYIETFGILSRAA